MCNIYGGFFVLQEELAPVPKGRAIISGSRNAVLTWEQAHILVVSICYSYRVNEESRAARSDGWKENDGSLAPGSE
jgi:hypothetical protein